MTKKYKCKINSSLVALIALILILSNFAILKISPALQVSASPVAEWQQLYGNSNQVSKVIQTSDGGYIFLGVGWSHQMGSAPTALYKIDSKGEIEWTKEMCAQDLVQTPDGGFAVVGCTTKANALFKFNLNGTCEWTQTYQNTGGQFLVATNDGGYAMAENKIVGVVDININGITVGEPIQSFALLSKTTSLGKIEWTKTYEINGTDNILAFSLVNLIQTSDGGYAMGGLATMNGSNDTNFCLVKISPEGDLQWTKTYGESHDCELAGVVQTSDGDYVLAGTSYVGITSQAWIVKTDTSGNVLWSNNFGGTESTATSVVQTSDGDLAFAGLTSGYYGAQTEMWLVKTDLQGNLQWQQTFVYTVEGQPSDCNGATSLIETSDGGFLVAGFSGALPDAWNCAYYLVKTTPILPAPTPSPIPIPTQVSATATPSAMSSSKSSLTVGNKEAFLCAGTASIIITVAVVLLLSRFRKNGPQGSQ